MQILDRAKLWKEGMMEQIKREITIMKDLREFAPRHRTHVSGSHPFLAPRGIHTRSMVSGHVTRRLEVFLQRTGTPGHGSIRASAGAAAPLQQIRQHAACGLAWLSAHRGSSCADHPHIVDLKEVMASKDKIYMVMEFMSGGELFDKIVADGPLEVSHPRLQCWDGCDGTANPSVTYHAQICEV